MVELIGRMLSKVSNLKFWITVIICAVIFTPGGYYLMVFLQKSNLLGIFNALPHALQEIFSPQEKWLEIFLGSLAPMLVMFGLYFHLYEIRMDEEKKKLLFELLPFIDKLDWLTKSPTILLISTGFVFVGVAIFFGFAKAYRGLWVLAIPLVLFFIAFAMRTAAGEIKTGERFSNWAKENTKFCAWCCYGLAVICWGYNVFYEPFNTLNDIYNYLQNSSITSGNIAK